MKNFIYLFGLAAIVTTTMGYAKENEPTTKPTTRKMVSGGVAIKPASLQWKYQRPISLNFRSKPLKIILKSIEKQSGIKVGPGWGADETIKKTKVSIRLDKTPFWETIVKVSRAAGIGFRVRRPTRYSICVKFTPKESVIRDYRIYGPVLIGLTSPLELYDRQDKTYPGFSLRILGFVNEEFDYATQPYVVLWAPDGKWQLMRHDGQKGSGETVYYYKTPKKHLGKIIRLTGVFPFDVNGSPEVLSAPLKPGAVQKHKDIILKITSVKKGQKETKIQFRIDWDTDLPDKDIKKYKDLIKKTETLPLTPADIQWIESIRKKANLINLAKREITGQNGKPLDLPGDSHTNNVNIYITGSQTIPNNPDAQFLRITVARARPVLMRFEFQDIFGVRDDPKKSELTQRPRLP